MSEQYVIFEKGDRVTFREEEGWHLLDDDLDPDQAYVVGAIADLPNPNDYYVDSAYWDDPKWAWARGKTRLDVSAHPQVIFLEGVAKLGTLPSFTPDPDNKNRRSFSGSWFQKVAWPLFSSVLSTLSRSNRAGCVFIC